MYVDDINLTGKKQNLDPMWKVLNKEVDLGEPTSFLDHVYLGCTQRQCEMSKDIVDNYRTMFESGISAGEIEKLPYPQIFVFLHGLMTWLVMQRSVWNDIVSWQTRRFNNFTKYPLHASLTTISKKKKWNLLENCHKYAPKLFGNAYTWHVLEDLIFYGQWTNLHDQSQNVPKPVTNVRIDWHLTCITHVRTNNIVMWVMLQNNAGWDCFKTPILQEILRIKNLLLVEHCAFLEVIHLFQ